MLPSEFPVPQDNNGNLIPSMYNLSIDSGSQIFPGTGRPVQNAAFSSGYQIRTPVPLPTAAVAAVNNSAASPWNQVLPLQAAPSHQMAGPMGPSPQISGPVGLPDPANWSGSSGMSQIGMFSQMPVVNDYQGPAKLLDPAPEPPPTIVQGGRNAYEIIGHVINFDKKIVTVQTAGRSVLSSQQGAQYAGTQRTQQKPQYFCSLKEGEWLPIQAGDIFYGLAGPPRPDGIYPLLTSPKIAMAYTDSVMEVPFRLALGIKFGVKTYNKLRAEFKNPKDLSDELDLYAIQKRPSKPHELSWKQWKKVVASWRRNRAYRQLYVWGMTEEQVDDLLDLAKCTTEEAMGWLKTNPEAIFTISDSQVASIRERNNLPQNEQDVKMRKVILEMYADLKQGYLSIPGDTASLEALGPILQTVFQRTYPVYVLGTQWFLRYPGMVVDGIRTFLKTAKTRVVRDLPPFVAGELKLASGKVIKISTEQGKALSRALRQALTVITGPAGTGKTTILRALYNFCTAHGLSIIVTAYTGKATARDREVLSSDEPCTLDLLCQKTTPGTLEVDFLCIDEVSQCSMDLFYRVMCLFKRPPQIVLIGDPNQLAPIRWGPFLDSLLESQWSVEYLTEIHRHKDNMLVNPHRVLQGMPIEVNPACIHFHTTNDDKALDQIRALVHMVLSEGRWTPWDVTVISPYDYIADKANQVIGNLIFGNNEYFNPGDRVVMRENAYEIEMELPEGAIRNPSQDPKLIAKGSVFNGEEGRVMSVNDEHVICKFGEKSFKFKWEVEYQKGRKKWNSGEEDILTTRMISRGYAHTVDRSQGSEWPFVIIYIPSLQRNATFVDRRRLYTALTRARDCVFLVGQIGEYNSASYRLFESKTIPLCD